MLNEASKLGIQEVLSGLDDESLFALAATTTQGLLKNKIDSRQEAVNAVLNYSADAISVLKRKLVTREILLAYLHKKNVSITLPATKSDLIQRITEYWNIQFQSNNAADSDTVALLAEEFAGWFYTIMNKNEVINSEHFFPDASLKVNMINNNQVLTDIIESNAQEIVQKLYMIKMNYRLFFNPNLSKNGVHGWIDSHGLIAVLVCGTLHANDVCVGVFEQAFALVRDPLADNNWKIKNTELNLKSESGIVALPTLQSSNLLLSLK